MAKSHSKLYFDLQELNRMIEWARARGWELEPIPPRASFEVARLRNPQSLGPPALYFRDDRGRYSTHTAGTALLREFRNAGKQ